MHLPEKYRPKTWDDVIGQDKAVAKLRGLISRPGFDRGAFLLTGPSGTGKTSLALIVADVLGCDGWSTRVIKGQDCSVDALRELADWFCYFPPNGGFKVAIVNECHLMSNGARSYALELMEAPPAKRVIVLTTTELGWADETLFSRFYTIPLRRSTPEIVAEHLCRIAEREGWPADRIDMTIFAKERGCNLRRCLLDLEAEVAAASLA